MTLLKCIAVVEKKMPSKTIIKQYNTVIPDYLLHIPSQFDEHIFVRSRQPTIVPPRCAYQRTQQELTIKRLNRLQPASRKSARTSWSGGGRGCHDQTRGDGQPVPGKIESSGQTLASPPSAASKLHWGRCGMVQRKSTPPLLSSSEGYKAEHGHFRLRIKYFEERKIVCNYSLKNKPTFLVFFPFSLKLRLVLPWTCDRPDRYCTKRLEQSHHQFIWVTFFLNAVVTTHVYTEQNCKQLQKFNYRLWWQLFEIRNMSRHILNYEKTIPVIFFLKLHVYTGK